MCEDFFTAWWWLFGGSELKLSPPQQSSRQFVSASLLNISTYGSTLAGGCHPPTHRSNGTNYRPPKKKCPQQHHYKFAPSIDASCASCPHARPRSRPPPAPRNPSCPTRRRCKNTSAHSSRRRLPTIPHAHRHLKRWSSSCNTSRRSACTSPCWSATTRA